MAIFHMSAKTVSRGKGQSAIAKAAYNARDRIRDEQTGRLKDYSRTAGVVFSAIFAPKNAPAWAHDRAALWNAVELAEKRIDAQLAREITLGLPHELTDQQRRQLVTDFVREQFQRQGMVADVNIHAPGGKGDDRNHHAHILLTMREIGPDGFGKKAREWNSREQLDKWREAWERTQNRYLERHGHEARVDRRTLEAQGIERAPTTHLGPHAHAMEQRKGVQTERGDTLRETFTSHQETIKLKRELASIERQIVALEHGVTVTRPAARETRAGGQPQPAVPRFQEAARTATERVRVQPQARPAANDNRPRPGAGAVKRGADVAAKVIGKSLEKTLDALGGMVESLFAPPTPKTAAQVEQDNKRHAAAANDYDRAFDDYLRETEHERTTARQQDETRRRQQERDEWERLQRGGRER